MKFSRFFLILYFLLCGWQCLYAQVNVLTQHNDLKRTGWNNNETILNPENVSSGQFGKIFTRDVDDQMYAQPLIVGNINIAGSIRNIVLLATVNNSVYAFDADDPLADKPLWQVNLTLTGCRPPLNTDMSEGCGGSYRNFIGNIGIVSTPVIDLNTKTIYVVTRNVTLSDTTFSQYLHALDIVTGKEKPNSPVYITASVPSYSPGNVNGVVTFDQKKHNQRAGLLLLNNTVYICWASHCDWGPYHGWVMGYDATSLQQKYVYNTTRRGGLAGGIWMSGQAPAVDDDGFIYLTTGNGTVGLNDGSNPNDTTNRGESLIKLTTASGALKIADFFTPSNWKYLEAHDLDFGSDGVLLIPDTHLSLSGSKESYLYLIDNTNMGHTTTDNSNVLQLLNINARNTVYQDHLHGTPVFYKNENGQEYIYAWAENAFLKQFPFNRSTMRFDTNRVTLGTTILGEGMPGAMLAVSSNSAQKGTGLLWASHPKSGNSINDIVPGMLQVFDANDVSKELWNSNINMARDSIGRFAKFVCPTIANGKVYMSTFSNKLAVYGLILNSYAPCGLPPAAPWRAANVGTNMIKGGVCENNGTFTLYSSGQNINNDSDQLFFMFQPFDSLSSGEIKARVLSISNTHVGAKCGVMFRSNLYPGAPNVFISKTNLDSAVLEYRTHTDSSSFIIAKTIIKAPSWVKLVKTGSIYTSYTSQDGIVWDTIDSLNIKMGKYLYAGIAFNTQNDTVTEVATVDSVTVLDYSIPTLEIRNLTANYINETKAQLHWISANEHPDNIFYVERSNDSLFYYVIDSVVATPGYQTHQYTYIDNTPSGGKNYYRIKQKLSTGASKNSNIASLNFIPYRLDVYPNPANRQIFIRYYDDFEIGSTVTIQLISSFGNLIYNSKIKIPIVSQTIVLDLPLNTKRGLYFLRIMNPKGKILTRKIIVGQ